MEQQSMPGGTLPFEPMGCGGLSQPNEADAEIQKICDRVKSHAETMMKRHSFEVFTAKTYTKQTVCGYNYFIKVHVGGDEYIHLLVFEDVCDGEGFKLKGIQAPKTRDDPIKHFFAM